MWAMAEVVAGPVQPGKLAGFWAGRYCCCALQISRRSLHAISLTSVLQHTRRVHFVSSQTSADECSRAMCPTITSYVLQRQVIGYTRGKLSYLFDNERS